MYSDTVTHRVELDGEYRLEFVRTRNDTGFGSPNEFGLAVDPNTGLEYLLNSDTLGYHAGTLTAGKRFTAKVTAAQYVTCILSVTG